MWSVRRRCGLDGETETESRAAMFMYPTTPTYGAMDMPLLGNDRCTNVFLRRCMMQLEVSVTDVKVYSGDHS